MGVILSSLLGLFGAALPKAFDFLQDGKDKKHELELIRLQTQRDKELGIQQASAIEIQGDAAILTAAINAGNQQTGIKFIDTLNGSVRPITTYLLIFMYILSKIAAYIVYTGDVDTYFLVTVMYTAFDCDLLAVTLGYYFGSRLLGKPTSRS